MHRLKHHLQDKTGQNWILMWEDIRGWTSSLEEPLLMIMHSYFSWKQNALMHLFLEKWRLHVFNLLTDGLEWCGYCDVFYQLFVWTLILTAPIHCRWSIAETLMQWHILQTWWRKTHILNGLRVSKCIFELVVRMLDLTSCCASGWSLALWNALKHQVLNYPLLN